MKKDWREAYVVCEHVAENPDIETRHSMFRVCCERCYKKGFLSSELNKEKVGKLSVGRIKERQEWREREKAHFEKLDKLAEKARAEVEGKQVGV